jgi:hypothetical protein
MNKRKLILAGVLLGTLALLAGVGISTYQTAKAAAPAVADRLTSIPLLGDEVVKGRGLEGQDDEYLAEALGITVDELNSARETARQALLAAAVEQDLITQAQADALNAGELGLPFGGRWSGWLADNGIDYNVFLADALGISVEQLAEARLTAHNARIDQAVADGDLTEEQALLMKARYALSNSENFKDSMQAALEAAIQQAVTDGTITQEQADLLLAQATQSGLHGFGWLGGEHGGPRFHGGGDIPDEFPAPGQMETP